MREGLCCATHSFLCKGFRKIGPQGSQTSESLQDLDHRRDWRRVNGLVQPIPLLWLHRKGELLFGEGKLRINGAGIAPGVHTYPPCETGDVQPIQSM